MPPAVSPAAPHELLPALRVLFGPGRGTDAERCRDALADVDRDPAAVLVARAGGRVCGAVLAQALPGALGVAWPPRAETPAAEDALAAAAVAWLRGCGVKVCQAFAAPADASDVAPLERSGFRPVTELVSLEAATGGLPAPTGALTFARVRPPFPPPFAAALLATHDGGLDCPELGAGRTPADVLAGFVGSGGVEHYLALHGPDPAGVVVLAPAEEPGAAELAYLGVVPALRGRGLGAELVRFAGAAAAAGGAVTLSAGVDARNGPAVRLYRRHGFTETDRRGVWLAHL
jgi:ribosomal protein S18 acetylase RimI-like enzyme